MKIRQQWETICFIGMIISTMLFFSLFFPIAHGTAIEDPLPTLQEKLLERAREWNIQKAINETLALAERFEK